MTTIFKKSKNIYTVSNFTKERIIKYFKKQENKIKIVYADVSKSFKEYNKKYEKEDYVYMLETLKKIKA